jgi:hypothetical protein
MEFVNVVAAHWQDAVNACLEVLAIFAVIASIRKALKDGTFKGYSAYHMAYSVGSASWFTYYYWHLSQWLSLSACVGYLAAVVTWATLMIAYRKQGDTHVKPTP